MNHTGTRSAGWLRQAWRKGAAVGGTPPRYFPGRRGPALTRPLEAPGASPRKPTAVGGLSWSTAPRPATTMGPMRTANTGQPSDGAGEGEGSTPLGGGYDAQLSDLTDGYGDGFDDEDAPSPGDSDTTAGTLEDLGIDEESVADLSESEAEAVLVDIVEAEGYSSGEAEDIVDDVQADTGMTATELLEDFVSYYEDTETSDDSVSVDSSEAGALLAEEPFDPLDLPNDSDLDLDHDGKLTQADAQQAHHAFDLDIDG